MKFNDVGNRVKSGLRHPALPIIALMLAMQLPLVWIGGPGNDWDGPNVIRSAILMVEEHTYERSRGPGHPVHEIGTAGLYYLGGQTLSNLGTVTMSVISIVSFLSIASHYKVLFPRLLAMIIVTNPWFWTYSTYSVDMVWAFGFLMSGYALLLKRHFIPAGILLGLAVGCRPPSILFALPILGEAWFKRDRFEEVKGHLIAIGTMGVVGAASYIPPFVEAGYSLSFLSDYNTGGFGLFEIIPRFIYKNIYLWGLPMAIGLVVFTVIYAKVLYGEIVNGENRRVILVSFLAIFAMEALFFRFPQKTAYLIPMLPFVVLLIDAILRSLKKRDLQYKKAILVGLIFLHLTYAAINFNIAVPDVPSNATTAKVGFFVEPGFLVKDVSARILGAR